MISHEDIEQLKDYFVTRKECDTAMDETKDQIAAVDKDVAVIKNDVKAVQKILWAVFTVLLGLLGTSVWNVIVK